MLKIKITSDSTCDLNADQVEKYGIGICPIDIILDGEVKQDGVEVSAEGVLDFVAKTGKLPKTAATTKERYAEFFSRYLSEGYEVIHFCISSKASSCYRNAVAAAEETKGVYVVDSMSLSGGQGLEILKAADLAEEGKSAKEIYDIISSSTDKVQLSFVVDTLEFLHKGGRCSSLALFGANLLKIRPSILVDPNSGKMSSHNKYRGKMEIVAQKYCDDTLKEFSNPDKSIGFITYTTATPEMVNACKDALKTAGFTTVIETHAGGTIASHCGANTIGILYFNDGGKTL